MLVVAEQRDGDLLFLRPCFLGERVISADSVNGGVQIAVCRQPAADVAHFRCASAGESHGKKKEQRVLLSEIIAQVNLLRPIGGLDR